VPAKPKLVVADLGLVAGVPRGDAGPRLMFCVCCKVLFTTSATNPAEWRLEHARTKHADHDLVRPPMGPRKKNLKLYPPHLGNAKIVMSRSLKQPAATASEATVPTLAAAVRFLNSEVRAVDGVARGAQLVPLRAALSQQLTTRDAYNLLVASLASTCTSDEVRLCPHKHPHPRPPTSPPSTLPHAHAGVEDSGRRRSGRSRGGAGATQRRAVCRPR